VLAQQLLFRHSSAGDLTKSLDWYFDTTTGPKTDPESYRRIAVAMARRPDTILFISEPVRELDAAGDAGMHTRMAMRPGNASPPDQHRHESIDNFNELFADPRS
jgi:enolase-phosphatase E1